MFKGFIPFVAMRYLRSAEDPAKGRRFLRFITYLSVGGVAVGVAALLLTLSIVRGFSKEIERKIVAFESHVQITSWRNTPISRLDILRIGLDNMPEVKFVEPIISDYILLKAPGDANIEGLLVRGVERPPPDLSGTIREGRFAFEPNEEGLPGLVIGRGLAQMMKLKLHDRVTVFSKPEESDSLSTEDALNIPIKTFRISGIFDSGMREFEQAFAFMDIHQAREMLGYRPFEASRVDVRVESLEMAHAIAQKVDRELGLASRFQLPIQVQTVFEAQEGLFAWTRLQEQIIPLLIGVIVLVAAFNLISMLLMLILEKTNEIGMLQSLGASGKHIRRLFLTLGVMIGMVGSGLGMALAWGLAMLQLRFHLIPLPVESYFMDTAPIELSGVDFVIVPLFALLLCVVASYFPARFASKIDPIQTIRFNG
ncbi:MAG: ABC transporter permease [Bacteroidetes Order II. Incertae sedis bacterium]|nr:ABC transporter permease [Bacteroidetes Order II. bacterium]